MKTKKYIPKRSRNNTTLTISLSKKLKETIENMAKKECRTMSQCITWHVQHIIAKEHPELYKTNESTNKKV